MDQCAANHTAFTTEFIEPVYSENIGVNEITVKRGSGEGLLAPNSKKWVILVTHFSSAKYMILLCQKLELQPRTVI